MLKIQEINYLYCMKEQLLQTQLKQNQFTQNEILHLLQLGETDTHALLQHAATRRNEHIGEYIYLRGLIELSNQCAKDCLYCGIRNSNTQVRRYELSDEEVLQAASFAHQAHYASIAIQAGELSSPKFVKRITHLLEKIHQKTNNTLGVTLSLGEQTKETYRIWREAGALRYLLRIETSNEHLFQSLHPANQLHDFHTRLQCLEHLREVDFQVGTGIMIGLPGQKLQHLVEDLIFMKDLDIDMCGMGPFIEHQGTPLWKYRTHIPSKAERLQLTLKMIASLRLLMPNINIAATTALQAIIPNGRELALQAGANVLMPNITPQLHRNDYALYEGKPQVAKTHEIEDLMQGKTHYAGLPIAFGRQGNSAHYKARNER